MRPRIESLADGLHAAAVGAVPRWAFDETHHAWWVDPGKVLVGEYPSKADPDEARLRLSMLADSVPWDEPWPDPHAAPSVIAARTFSVRSRRLPAWVGLLALLEDFVLTWDPVREGARTGATTGDPARESPTRVSPAAPKRHGDPVYSSAGWRCTAPGCTSRKNLDDHHVVYRSAGGSDEPSNRRTLCASCHHHLVHAGKVVIGGTAPDGLTFLVGPLPNGGAREVWHGDVRMSGVA